MPSIRLTRLRMQFASVIAVDGISLDFNDGELTSILGPSGCGKTTTLNAIAGFVDLDGGSIHFGDSLIADAASGFFVPPNKRNLGMVFQSYALWPHFSIAENVAYGLKMRGVPRAERDEAVRRSLARVRLDRFGDRFPHELSGGQQQRVALARAIVYSPKILLFDEPLSNLDAQLREEMRLELKELHRELGVTAVYVTHDQAEAMGLSDRIVVMWEGQVLQIGSSQELYEQPADVRVAQFLGRTNVFEARLTAKGGPLAHAAIEGMQIPIGCRVARDTASDAVGVLSIRPEGVSVHSANARGGDISGRVASTMYLGYLSQLHIRLESGKTIEALELNQRAWNVGDAVTVSFDPERCFFISRVPQTQRPDL